MADKLYFDPNLSVYEAPNGVKYIKDSQGYWKQEFEGGKQSLHLLLNGSLWGFELYNFRHEREEKVFLSMLKKSHLTKIHRTMK